MRDEQTIRLAWEGVGPTWFPYRVTVELGLGPARGIRARLLVMQP